MEKIVDVRVMAPAQAAAAVRTALEESDTVTAIVAGEAARLNVVHVAERAGARVRVQKERDGIYLNINKEKLPTEKPAAQPAGSTAGGASLVLVVQGDSLGRGDAELGQILVRSFFHTLGDVQPVPTTVVFLNGGVKLVAEGSPVLEDLRALAERGVDILACGTCLGYYELKDKVAVGAISNMHAIAEILLRAGKTVSL